MTLTVETLKQLPENTQYQGFWEDETRSGPRFNRAHKGAGTHLLGHSYAQDTLTRRAASRSAGVLVTYFKRAILYFMY